MRDLTHLFNRFALTLLSTTLCACIVTPKKVAGYDEKCMVTTQKFELTLEQVQAFEGIDCISESCKAEVLGAVVSSTLITTTSAVVSGSIALVGNTLYWLESQGKCPSMHHMKEEPPKKLQEKMDEQYIIQEEIITAKS